MSWVKHLLFTLPTHLVLNLKLLAILRKDQENDEHRVREYVGIELCSVSPQVHMCSSYLAPCQLAG